MIKAIIIDDEKLARDLIRNYLEKALTADIEIVAECGDGFEGIKAIQQYKPDLIFLDIQMPKLSGFEMIELLDKLPVIVFSTAYQEHALKAFELSAADYLLKPYSLERFNEAINKAKNRIKDTGSNQSVEQSILIHHQQSEEQLTRIVMKNNNKIVIIPIEQIEYISGEDDYVAVHSEGKKYLKQLTLKYLETKLPKDQFIRIHRSYIVAINQIDRLEAYSKDSFMAILKNDHKINVSRTGYNALKKVLDF